MTPEGTGNGANESEINLARTARSIWSSALASLDWSTGDSAEHSGSDDLSRKPNKDSDRAVTPEHLSEGRNLIRLLFADAQAWCNRRALLFEFEQERRGQWSNVIDFDQPDVNHIPCLVSRVGDRVSLPLLSISKEMLPPAHVQTRDEHGDWLSLEESGVGRLLAYKMLLAAADDAELCLACAPAVLWQLTGSDTVESFKAWCRLHDLMHSNGPLHGATRAPNSLVPRFLNLARLFHRSVLLVIALSATDTHRRKIVTVSFDGPIRVTKRFSESLGLAPRVIAPRTMFGGNARSYHIQILPSERVTVVDSRLLYSYYATQPMECTDDRPLEYSDSLMADAQMESMLEACCTKEWWGHIEGPAEPMSAHVRGSNREFLV